MSLITIDNNEKFLRQISKCVDFHDQELTKNINILEKYCLENEVYAMASVQLGIPKRLIYIKNTNLKKIKNKTHNEKIVLINPVILKKEGLTKYWEACASCGDNMGLVERPYKVIINYYDLNGKKHIKTFKGFRATVFSHEYDHLFGILHMDRALELKVMTIKEREKYRKTHGYEIISTTGNFNKY